jgi:hypothetical protein
MSGLSVCDMIDYSWVAAGVLMLSLARQLTFAILVVAVLYGCSSGPLGKANVDAEVDRLCAIDGGIKVYETVKLPTDKFDKYGNIAIPLKDVAKPQDEYYYEWVATNYQESNPVLRRDHFKIIRKSDGMVLGEDISYARRGGDVGGPWHESSYRCPKSTRGSSLESLIFKKSTQN